MPRKATLCLGGGRASAGLSADSDLRRTFSCWVQGQIEFSKEAEFAVGHTVGTQDREGTLLTRGRIFKLRGLKSPRAEAW